MGSCVGQVNIRVIPGMSTCPFPEGWSVIVMIIIIIIIVLLLLFFTTATATTTTTTTTTATQKSSKLEYKINPDSKSFA
jgi:uncharacterized membrane protein